MPTPLPSRQPTRLHTSDRQDTRTGSSDTAEWRCTRCGKLLGLCQAGRMHLRFARGHEYFVGFPVVANCRGCATLNQASGPALL